MQRAVNTTVEEAVFSMVGEVSANLCSNKMRNQETELSRPTKLKA
jgi:hypothetical protein